MAAGPDKPDSPDRPDRPDPRAEPDRGADRLDLLGGTSVGRDALLGLVLCLVVLLTLLFSTGEDSSFIYIDF